MKNKLIITLITVVIGSLLILNWYLFKQNIAEEQKKRHLISHISKQRRLCELIVRNVLLQQRERDTLTVQELRPELQQLDSQLTEWSHLHSALLQRDSIPLQEGEYSPKLYQLLVDINPVYLYLFESSERFTRPAPVSGFDIQLYLSKEEEYIVLMDQVIAYLRADIFRLIAQNERTLIFSSLLVFLLIGYVFYRERKRWRNHEQRTPHLFGEDLINRFFKKSADAVFELDEEGRIIWVNPAMANQLREQPNKLKNRVIWLFAEESQQAVLKRQFLFLVKDQLKSSFYLEVQLQTPNGNLSWFGITLTIIKYPDRSNRILAVARDISRYKKIVLESHENKVSLEDYLNKAPIGIFQIDINGHCVFVNKEWEQLTGQSLQQAIGEGWFYSVYRQDQSKIMELWKEVPVDQQIITNRFRLQHIETNQITWVENKALILRDRNKQPTGFMGFVWTIPESAQSKQEETETFEQLRLFADNSRELYWILNFTEHLISFNFRFEQVYKALTGNKPYRGQSFDITRFQDISRDKWDHYLDQVKSGREVSHTISFQQEGQEKTFDLKIIPIRKQGNAVGAAVLGIETGKEGASVSINVRENTFIRLINEYAHVAKTAFFSIQGTISLLKNIESQLNIGEEVEFVQVSTENLNLIFRNVFDYTRSLDATFHANDAIFNLKNTVTHCVKIVENCFKLTRTECVLEYDEQIPEVLIGDASRLEQVLYCLSHFIFMKLTQKALFQVKKRTQQDQECSLLFSINLKGRKGLSYKGVPLDEPDKTATLTKLKEKSIDIQQVALLLEAMSSGLKLSSSSEGYQLYFEITFKQVPDEMKGRETEGKFFHFENKLSVLLVENDPICQKITAKLIESWGGKCLVTDNEQQALEWIKEKKTDLILMDIHLPQSTGYKVSHSIREMEGAYFTQLPIIAYTVKERYEIEEKMAEAGIDNYIIKSPDLLTFNHMLYKYFTLSPLRDEESVPPVTDTEREAVIKEPDDSSSLYRVLHKLARGDKKFISELGHLYKLNLIELYNRLQLAVLNRDRDEASRIRLKMMPTLTTLELNDLKSLIDQIMDDLKKRRWKQARDKFTDFEVIYQRSINKLNEII